MSSIPSFSIFFAMHITLLILLTWCCFVLIASRWFNALTFQQEIDLLKVPFAFFSLMFTFITLDVYVKLESYFIVNPDHHCMSATVALEG